jgi:hypothetical protein
MTRKARIEKQAQAAAEVNGIIAELRQQIGIALPKARRADSLVAEALLLAADATLADVWVRPRDGR